MPDKYNELKEKLSEISNDYSAVETKGLLGGGDEYIARLKLLEPFLRTEVQLAKKSLISSPNCDWFEEMNKLLSDIYSEYEVGLCEK